MNATREALMERCAPLQLAPASQEGNDAYVMARKIQV